MHVVMAVTLWDTQVAATTVSVSLMDVVGRRRLLGTSCYICIFSMVALGAIYSFGDTGEPEEVALTDRMPVLFVVLFVVGFSIGLGPVIWLLAAELVPLRGLGILMGLTCAFNWMCAFAVTLFFNVVRDSFHFSRLGWFFSSVTFAGFLLMAFFMPETKGRTLEDILLESPRDIDDFAIMSKESTLLHRKY